MSDASEASLSDTSEVSLPTARPDRGGPLFLVVLGCLVFCVVLLAGIFGARSLYIEMLDEVEYRKVRAVSSPTLETLRAWEEDALTTYKVIDKEKGIYQIPIEHAMALAVREANTPQPAPVPSEARPPVDRPQ